MSIKGSQSTPFVCRPIQLSPRVHAVNPALHRLQPFVGKFGFSKQGAASPRKASEPARHRPQASNLGPREVKMRAAARDAAALLSSSN